jgi:glucosamine-6-phosphate deaminase
MILKMNRSKEVRQLNSLSVEEIKAKAGNHLMIRKNSDDMYLFFAEHIINTIRENNKRGKTTSGIFPFGPVGQYPYFIDMVNKDKTSLANTCFFFMDEYADINGIEIPLSHKLSFRGKLFEMFKKISKDLLPDYSKIIFPSSDNIYNLKKTIEKENLCVTYGGVGIHGHLAFNEPEKGVRDTDPRIVQLNDYTVTINAIRDSVGGNLENFPRKALTLGMNQLFSAEKMVFFCRNGIPSIDWANTVLRLALLGEPGDDYPVTYLKEHKDWLIVTDEDTIRTPVYI